MFKRLAKSLDCQEFITHLPALRLFFYPVTNKSLVNIAFKFFLKKWKWFELLSLGGGIWWAGLCGATAAAESCSRSRTVARGSSSPTHQRPNHLTPEPNPSHGTPKMDQKGAKNGLKRDPILLSIYDSWYTKTAHLLLFQYLMKWLTYWGQWYWQCFGTKYEKWKTF